jgi:hypothetical protein
MPIRQDANYKEFTERYEPQTTVFFVGAGLSQPLFPSWRDVLLALLKLCIDRGSLAYNPKELQGLIERGQDYIDIADILADSLDPQAFREFVEQVFDKDIKKPSVPASYRRLFELRPRLVITTNYDRIPNLIAPRYRVFTNKQADEALRSIKSERDTIFKIHGDITDQESIVLTRKHYERVIHQDPKLQSVLHSVFTSRTVLFIGFSLADPNLALLLSSLKAIHPIGVNHYALMTEMSSFRASVFERTYGVKVIRYKPADSSHPEVAQMLASLANPEKPPQLLDALFESESDSELAKRLLRYEDFDSRGIIHVTSSNNERIHEYKQCLLEAVGDCFISGTSMIHLSEDSKELLRRKIKDGATFRLLIMDPAWIRENCHLLTFLSAQRARENFHVEIENSIEKLLDLSRTLLASELGRLRIRKYKTFFPYIITGFCQGEHGKLVVEVTDYLPEDQRPRFTLHATGTNDTLFAEVKRKFDALWGNTQLTEEVVPDE